MPQDPPRLSQLPPAWRRAILALDQALQQNDPGDNSELIDLIGRKHFGPLWDLKPGDPSPFDTNPNKPSSSSSNE